MAPVDKSYTIYYQSAIVRAALSCTVVDLFDAENIVDLEICDSGHSKVISIKKPAYGFLFVFHSNYGCIFNRFETIYESDRKAVTQSASHSATARRHSLARQQRPCYLLVGRVDQQKFVWPSQPEQTLRRIIITVTGVWIAVWISLTGYNCGTRISTRIALELFEGILVFEISFYVITKVST